MPAEQLQPHEKNFHWLALDPQKGAPFNLVIPLGDPRILEILKEPGSFLSPFSRWTIGRKSNPNFTTGSGFEGHLAAFTPAEVVGVLGRLQDGAYESMKREVGAGAIGRFLDDPSKPISLRFLRAGKESFEIALAKARALRSMVEQGGYYYTSNGELKIIEHNRRDRSTSYTTFVYRAPSIVDGGLTQLDSNTLCFGQIVSQPHPLPIPAEPLGGDIAANGALNLVAELGRFGHPIVTLLGRDIY